MPNHISDPVEGAAVTWTGEVDKATACDWCKGIFLVAWRPAVWFCQDCRQTGKRIPGWPVQP